MDTLAPLTIMAALGAVAVNALSFKKEESDPGLNNGGDQVKYISGPKIYAPLTGYNSYSHVYPRTTSEGDTGYDDIVNNKTTNKDICMQLSIDHKHSLILDNDVENNDLLRVVCPVPEVLSGMSPNTTFDTPKNQITSLAYFVPETFSKMYLTGITPSNADHLGAHVYKYMKPLFMLLTLNTKFNKSVVRLYFDNCSYNILKKSKCFDVNWTQLILPKIEDVNQFDESISKYNTSLYSHVYETMTKVNNMWKKYVKANVSVMDAMACVIWFLTSGQDINFLESWSQSAQIFVVDVKNCRPEWIINNDGNDYLIHNGYIASCYRLFGMRQYDDITFEHNGLQVRWGKPTGYRCRDAHAATPSKGDIQHVEKFMSSKYRYEWCVPIGYTPEWAAMSDDPVPSPGCGFINAKCLGNDKTEMIMPNEDYEYCTGMLFDRTKMNIIKDHRRYKVPQDGVDGKYLIYGIDEVLLAVATGFLPRSEFTATHPDDYVTMIYQKKCENSHNDIKSADVATYSEYNELAKLRDRSNNSVVENSTMFNLIYLWAKVVNGSVDDAWNGELLPSTDSLVCENLKNTKFPSYVQARHTACKLFFPTHISMSCNWLMKPSTCSSMVCSSIAS